MIEVVEVSVEVFCPTRKTFDSFYRCGQKWPSGKTKGTIRVLRDSWLASVEETFDAKRRSAKTEDDKKDVDAERSKFHDELQAAYLEGCVPQVRFDMLMEEKMLSTTVISHRKVQYTPEIPKTVRKTSILDQLDQPPAPLAKGK